MSYRRGPEEHAGNGSAQRLDAERPVAGRASRTPLQKTRIMGGVRWGLRVGMAPRMWACLIAVTGMIAMADMVNGAEQGAMGQAIALPETAAGWRWDAKEQEYDARTLFEYMNGGAEFYLAYGVQGLRVRKFERENQPLITLELYEMASAADAWGVFSFERHDDAVGIGQGSEFGGGLLRFWKGKKFVRIYADGEGPEVESAMLAMGRVTADAIRETGSEPALVGAIPGTDRGLVDRSVRYLRSHVLLNQRVFIAHQNILNLSRRTEAVLAQYTRDEQKVHLLVVRYPSAKEARDAYASFTSAYIPNAPGKDLVRTEERKWTLARQRGEIILVVLGAPTAADAEALFKATEEHLPQGG